MKNKKVFVFVLICMIIFFIFYYIFIFLGNNKNINQDEIVDKILNSFIKYEANIIVHVISNKNETYYNMFQSVNNNESKVIINEPENIKGMIIEKNNNCLKISNPKINMEKIYSNYNVALNNSLFLNTFIEEFKNNKSEVIEEEDKIILKIKLDDNFNTYANCKELYVNKKTGEPEELVIKDNTQRTRICIIYNDIKIK